MQQLEFVNCPPSLSLSIEKRTPQNVQSASVQMRPQRVSTVLNLIESMKKKKFYFENTRFSGKERSSIAPYNYYENPQKVNLTLTLNWIMHSIRISMVYIAYSCGW